MENEKKLHPSVIEFKHFINEHPGILKEIRKSGRSWQEYYEKWILLGEEDPYWQQFIENEKKEKKESASEEKNFELFQQLIKLTENLDVNKIQHQVTNLSKTVSTIQEMIEQFQQSKNKSNPEPGPFHWFRD